MHDPVFQSGNWLSRSLGESSLQRQAARPRLKELLQAAEPLFESRVPLPRRGCLRRRLPQPSRAARPVKEGRPGVCNNSRDRAQDIACWSRDLGNRRLDAGRDG